MSNLLGFGLIFITSVRCCKILCLYFDKKFVYSTQMYDFYELLVNFSSPTPATGNGISVSPMQTPDSGNMAPFKRVGKKDMQTLTKHTTRKTQIYF